MDMKTRRMVGWIKKMYGSKEIDGWIKQIDGWLKGKQNFKKQIVGWMDRIPQKNGWMDRQMNGRMDIKNRCMVGWT